MFGLHRWWKRPETFSDSKTWMEPSDYPPEVTEAIYLLDQIGVKGWWRRIDPTRLDLISSTSCVLGQVYGSFRSGQFYLFPNYSMPGFMPSKLVDGDYRTPDPRLLAWKCELSRRALQDWNAGR